MPETPAQQAYVQRVADLRRALLALPGDAPVRLRKPARTSNLFRPRSPNHDPLDVAGFSGVIALDPAARTADVLGMTTYEDLVAATLPHGLIPLVVPQLKTITLGGAVTGLGIESTSFRNGCPHESVLEMDILTGTGEVVTATPTNEHRDLFFGFTNSYGTLGYTLRLRIELEPVTPYVHLRHLRFDDLASATTVIERLCQERSHGGEPVDFLDGTWFGSAECYLTLGSYADEAPPTSDYTGQQIYYRSIQQHREDWLTTHDYLWRWDTDWFWCSRAFGTQRRWVRPLWPRRWRRSDVYWRLIALERRYGVKRGLDRARLRPAQEEVIQDVEIPVDRVADFVEFLDQRTGIRPVWLCPLRQRDPSVRWELYPLDPSTTYVNVGFWSTVGLPPGAADGHHNRAIEQRVAELGGRKSLYSTAFYPEDEFWSTYGGDSYAVLKKTYDPDGRLLDLYAKTVGRQ
ncbi:MAG TPA: FAD-binding oxidoreductase [Mycobacteriales bacterium]|nr:FAD-binding oxidoreductase [Mycobacteriales bacterium]